ncbi:MAG: DnaB-like helicase N-terminal domain-containing protein [Ilumatobacteraceae bacterium]
MSASCDPLPADVYVEAALLGAALLDAKASAIVAELDPYDWYSPTHRTIAVAVVELVRAGHPVDPLTVADGIRHAGHHDIGVEILHRLFVETPSVSSAGRYSSIVRRHARGRRLVHAAHELSTAAMTGDEDQIRAAAGRIATELGEEAP